MTSTLRTSKASPGRAARRRLVTVLATTALLATSCGGGGSSTPEAGGTPEGDAAASTATDAPVREDADLVIWTSDVAARAVTPIAEEFGEENGITVAVQVVAADLAANAVTANAAGNGPDVLTLPNDFLGQALQNGAVDPLPLQESDLEAYDEGAVASVTRDGQVWALPYAIESLVLYRNTDVAPEAPETVEGMLAAGRAGAEAGTVERALSLPVGQDGNAYHMHPFFTSGGGSIFALEDGQYDPQQVEVGSPGSVAAAEQIAALGEEGTGDLTTSIDGSNAIAQFTDGRAAFLVSGPWALSDIRDSEVPYGISPVPGFEGGDPAAPFLGVQAFWTMSNAQNPAFADEFVTVAMNTPEAMTALYEEDPRPPAHQEVLQAVSADDPDIALLAEGAQNATLLPDFPFMSGVWPAMNQAYAAVVGGADPATTMEQTATTVEDVVPD